ncbi:hypothetical protein C5167_043698, partial [Papaver somniferum]
GSLKTINLWVMEIGRGEIPSSFRSVPEFSSTTQRRFNECLPVYEQPRDDEDSSSDSSVDYSYSEEEGDKSYKSDDDDDDDDDDGDGDEVGMTDSTATKKNKKIESTTGTSLRERLEKLEWKVFHTRGFKRTFQSRLKQWICSWNAQTPFVWVHVHAYYNKHKLYGGYGVILRDSDAKPITASANFSVVGKSFYTQLLMGVMAGVTLVKNLRLPKLRVVCNSIKIPHVIDKIWDCKDIACRENKQYTYNCKWCWRSYFVFQGADRDLVPHARDIKAQIREGLELLELTGYLGYLNKAAYYLAKMGKKNRAKVENQEERIASSDEGTGEIKPCDFPQELKQILWRDAEGVFRTMHYRREPLVTQV